MTKTLNKMTGILLTVDRQQIHYDHYKNGFDKVVIVVHGFFNSKDAVLLKELSVELSADYDVLIFDFRGHGKSSGLFYWTTQEYRDLEAVLEYAKGQYRKIGVIGFSLGAATSLITAARSRDMDSLVSVSAPVDFLKIEYCFWRLDPYRDIYYNIAGEGRIGKGIRPGPFWEKKERPIDIAGKIKIPVFYIHGQSDWLIKPWHSQELYKNTQSPKKLAIIENGPHAEYLILTHKEKTVRLIRDWFKQTLAVKKEENK